MKLVDGQSVKLFEKPVIQLSNIVKIDESGSSIGQILVYLGTNTRFSNFEAFTGKKYRLLVWKLRRHEFTERRNLFLRVQCSFFTGLRDRKGLIDGLFELRISSIFAKEMDQESADYIQSHISSRAW